MLPSFLSRWSRLFHHDHPFLGCEKIKLFNGDDYKRELEELTQKKAEDNNFECHVSDLDLLLNTSFIFLRHLN